MKLLKLSLLLMFVLGCQISSFTISPHEAKKTEAIMSIDNKVFQGTTLITNNEDTFLPRQLKVFVPKNAQGVLKIKINQIEETLPLIAPYVEYQLPARKDIMPITVTINTDNYGLQIGRIFFNNHLEFPGTKLEYLCQNQNNDTDKSYFCSMPDNLDLKVILPFKEGEIGIGKIMTSSSCVASLDEFTINGQSIEFTITAKEIAYCNIDIGLVINKTDKRMATMLVEFYDSRYALLGKPLMQKDKKALLIYPTDKYKSMSVVFDDNYKMYKPIFDMKKKYKIKKEFNKASSFAFDKYGRASYSEILK